MERKTGILRNTKHADSSSALNMLQQQGITSVHGGSGSSIASSTHLMSAPNPIYNSGGSMANSSTNANNDVVDSNRGSGTRRSSLRVQDQYLPTANVVRIMRRALPGHAKISDDAKEAVQVCVSEYISFITGEANDKCQGEQRKTITAEDVLSAMRKLGFDNYIPYLSTYLTQYRQSEHVRTTQRTVPTETRVYNPPLPPMVANESSHNFDYGPLPTETNVYNPPLPPMLANGSSYYFDYGGPVPTETYVYNPPLAPTVANDSSHYFDNGPVPNPQGMNMNMNMMTPPWDLPGPSVPNYGPDFEFQYGPNNSGMFDALGQSGSYGNTLGDGTAGGSSSQNAVPNFDPSTHLFK